MDRKDHSDGHIRWRIGNPDFGYLGLGSMVEEVFPKDLLTGSLPVQGNISGGSSGVRASGSQPEGFAGSNPVPRLFLYNHLTK